MLLALVVTTGALARLKPAAPSVARSTVWIDTVKRGEMLRQVRGSGTLVPEHIRWISSVVSGRVEKILAQPGAEVTAESVLLELSNPDVQLEALEPQRQLAAEEAEFVNLKANLEADRLNQEAVVASANSDYLEARRQADADVELAQRGLIAGMVLDRAKDRAEELKTRLGIEKQRLDIRSASLKEQIQAKEVQVERLRTITEFHDGRVRAMRVVAGAAGMLQELPLEAGQWVVPGTVLAKVAEPGRLKALIHIPESQAGEVVVGQPVDVDMHSQVISGRVARVDPAVQNGAVTVDVRLEGDIPDAARSDVSVDGTINVERLENVLYVGRPAYGQAQSLVGMFRLDKGGRAAARVNVRLGRSSVSNIEIVEGLAEGDQVILSDMSAWDAYERVRLK